MHININFPGLEGVILKEFRSFEDRVEILLKCLFTLIGVLDVVQELKIFMIIEFKKLDI